VPHLLFPLERRDPSVVVENLAAVVGAGAVACRLIALGE